MNIVKYDFNPLTAYRCSGDAVDGAQNPCIWTGNDGDHWASYEITARTVKFLGRRDNGGPPIGEPLPEG